MGMGRVRQLAAVQLTESAVILVPAWFGLQAFGIAGLLAAMALSIMVMSGWALPLMFYRAIRRLPDGSTAGENAANVESAPGAQMVAGQ